MHISKSAIALAVTAALSSMTSAAFADAKVAHNVRPERAPAACDPSGICLVSTVGTDLSANACGGADTIQTLPQLRPGRTLYPPRAPLAARGGTGPGR